MKLPFSFEPLVLFGVLLALAWVAVVLIGLFRGSASKKPSEEE